MIRARWPHTMPILGTVLVDHHQYDSAFYLYDESIRISRQSNYAFGEIVATFNLAKAKSRSGNYSESQRLLGEVYQFCATNNITEGMLRSLLPSIRILLRPGRLLW